jgi:hypothetical protein
MALELKINVTSNNQGGFIFREDTGQYSVTNLTGWGSPNPTLASVVDVTLEVFLPDSSTYLPTSNSVVLDSGDNLNVDFPTSDYTKQFDITGQMLGGSAGSDVPDGVYEFLYTVTVSPDTEYSISKYAVMIDGVMCCISKLSVDAIEAWCGCGCDKKTSRFESGMLMIEAAKYAVFCGNITATAAAISNAVSVCNGCSDC